MTAALDILTPRRYQEECLAALGEAYGRGVRRAAAVLATGLGKGHPLETEVPTPIGLRTWGDLVEGDEIFGPNGHPTRITSIHDRGILPTYRVSFSDGTSVEVDGDHLWTVRDGRARWRTMSTESISSEDLKPGHDGWRFRIPMTRSVWRPDASLPLAPYVVGSLIANGGMLHAGTMLTTPDMEVVRRVAVATTCNQINDTTPGTCARYSLPGLTAVTRDLGLRVHSRRKRIPRVYLEASHGQRLELLHGLMDGDGSSRAKTNRRSVGYFTTSPNLASDVVELVSSLGGTASISKYDRDAKGIEYAVFILLPAGLTAFSDTGNKGATPIIQRNHVPKRAIVSIDYVGLRAIRCITVSSPDSLYLVTRNYIVTHNTVIFAHMAARWTASIDCPGRVVILVHRDELVRQAVGKLHTVAPHLRIGVVKATENDVHADVIVASVQTLRKANRQRQLLDAGNVGLVVVDECHHSVSPTYLNVLSALGVMAGRTLAAGFTATMDREDNKALGHVWQEIVYERDILWGIQNGHLVDVKGVGVTVDDFDMRKVRTTAGDYSEHDLGEALENSHAPEIIAKAYREHAPDKPGLVFAPTVATSQLLADTLTEHDIPTRHVDGTTPTDERRQAVEDLTTGKIQALSNCALFTEGTDIPIASVCVVARPTRSNALYVQMVGRVLRPHAASGNRQALVLDIVGAAARNSLVGLTRLTGRQVYDEESLLEADVRLTEEELAALAELDEAATAASSHGPDAIVEIHASETRELDLFHGSRQQWLTSPEGWRFLPSGEWLVAILPSPTEPGRWDVGAFSVVRPRGQYLVRGLDDIGYALAQAEQSAAKVADPDKNASWRLRKTKIGERRYAETLGVDLANTSRNTTAGELADLTAIEHARRTIDPGVRAMMGSAR